MATEVGSGSDEAGLPASMWRSSSVEESEELELEEVLLLAIASQGRLRPLASWQFCSKTWHGEVVQRLWVVELLCS